MQTAGEHLVGQDAERPDVGGRPHHAAPALPVGPPFGRYVVEGAQRRHIGVGAVEFDGESEVAEPHPAVRSEQHVSGLQIAVDPAAPVDVGQRGGDPGEDAAGVGQWCGRAVAVCGEHVLEAAVGAGHHQCGGAVEFGALGVVDGEDFAGGHHVRVVGVQAEPHLAPHQLFHGSALAGRQQMGGQQFDRGLAAVGGMGRRVHDAPTARADRAGQQPVAHPVAGGQVDPGVRALSHACRSPPGRGAWTGAAARGVPRARGRSGVRARRVRHACGWCPRRVPHRRAAAVSRWPDSRCGS